MTAAAAAFNCLVFTGGFFHLLLLETVAGLQCYVDKFPRDNVKPLETKKTCDYTPFGRCAALIKDGMYGIIHHICYQWSVDEGAGCVSIKLEVNKDCKPEKPYLCEGCKDNCHVCRCDGELCQPLDLCYDMSYCPKKKKKKPRPGRAGGLSGGRGWGTVWMVGFMVAGAARRV